MEERAHTSVSTDAIRGKGTGFSFSPVVVLAMLSVVALISVSAWQASSPWRTANAPQGDAQAVTKYTTTSKSLLDWQRAPVGVPDSGAEVSGASNDPNGLSNIEGNVLGTIVGSYSALIDSGTYTTEQGEEVASAIAEDLRANISYRIYSVDDISTDADTSLERMLSYRGDVREALEPLLENTTYELEVFAYYVDTNDAVYLDELHKISQNYRSSLENLLEVVTPQDAVTYHVGILNALSEFETTLTQMTNHASDPFASAALLRTFNDSEANMLLSFDALATYFREHSQS